MRPPPARLGHAQARVGRLQTVRHADSAAGRGAARLVVHLRAMADEPIGTDSIRALTREVLRFRDDRDWKQFHNAKDMAISLSLEAAELLELVQWKNGAELDAHLSERREALEHELSDVLYWLLLISHDFGIDLGEAFLSKMRHNETKYPVERARSRSDKYTELGAEPTE